MKLEDAASLHCTMLSVCRLLTTESRVKEQIAEAAGLNDTQAISPGKSGKPKRLPSPRHAVARAMLLGECTCL